MFKKTKTLTSTMLFSAAKWKSIFCCW